MRRIIRIMARSVLILTLLASCQKEDRPLWGNNRFKIFENRVEQDSFVARAQGDSLIESNYQSISAKFIKPDIEFKFSINGKDNELGFNIDHKANIAPQGNETVVLDLVFGHQSILRGYGSQSVSLPSNTKVRFRVDMRAVLRAFAKDGFYTDAHGGRIFSGDFQGVFVAGSTYPLSWDFDNLAKNEASRLSDADGDSIYEVEMTFNKPESSKKLASQWRKSKDLSGYPAFESSVPLLNALYNLSLEEMLMNIESDSTFRTGKEWAGVWTRDVSYSIMLAMGMLQPEVAKKSLMYKVRNKRIVQDTGTGGAWPCSSDRVVWTLAAWEIYEYTGDKDWLRSAFEIASNSVKDDEMTLFDRETGLVRGESSFLDWREQTYPRWAEPADIYASLNLGTNAVYYQVLKVLGQMASELGEPNLWVQKAEGVREAINQHLWLSDKGYYGQYLYGRQYKTLSPRSEALGEAFTVLFDVANEERRLQVLAKTPVLDYGIPCIYPQIPNIKPYHNNGIWPFVQAFWTMANAKEKHANGVEYGLATIMRQAALFLTNKENFVAQDGDYLGTAINSDRQLWSISGQLAMVYKVLFGISFNQRQLCFSPVVPKSFGGKYRLSNFKYRNALLDITIEGYGSNIESFKVDGVPTLNYSVGNDLRGKHEVYIKLDNQPDETIVSFVENMVTPETPSLFYANNSLNWTATEGAMEYRIYKNGELIDKTRELNYLIRHINKVNEYQVSSYSSDSLESFLSNPVILNGTNNVITLQAESNNLKRQSYFGGYNGNGYVLMSKKKSEQLNFSVNVPIKSEYWINFRYANGNGPINTDNKCAIRSLFINDVFVAALVFPQRGNNEWRNWGYTNLQLIELNAGLNRFSIKFLPSNENMNDEVNDFALDEIIISQVE